MGSAGTNFYNDAFERQGYGDDIREVQRLWLAGDKDAARRRVPTAIGLGTNLIGTDDLVRDRLRLYRDAGITTLRANLHGDPAHDLRRQLGDLARLLDLVHDVNEEPATATLETEDEPRPQTAAVLELGTSRAGTHVNGFNIIGVNQNGRIVEFRRPATLSPRAQAPRPRPTGRLMTDLRLDVYTSPMRDLSNGGQFSPTTATLVLGPTEAVLVDTQYTESDVAELAGGS